MLVYFITLLISVCFGALVSLYLYSVLRKSGKLIIMPPKIAKTIYIGLGILAGLFCYFLFDSILMLGSVIKYGWVW